jgi:hypothetical protein
VSFFEANSSEILILLSTLFLVLILLATFRGKKRKLPEPRAAEAAPKAGAPNLGGLNISGLTTFDREVLQRLAWLFRNPGSVNKITSDEEMFLKAARRGLAEGLATDDELRSLGRHLGFDAHKLRDDHLSTRRLGSGVEISLADDQMHSGAGEIASNHPAALKVRLRSGAGGFKPGRTVDVICKGREGLYRFETKVQGLQGRQLLLDHTSELERVQRRKHRRRQLRLPVELKAGNVVAGSRTQDISIGGAAIRNPRKQFGPGESVKVSFEFGGRERLTIPAEVVRTSRGNGLLHMRFARVEDDTRHRLFRAIMASGGK